MSLKTIALGLTIKIPTLGHDPWTDDFENEFARKISQHGHTGSPDGLQITAAGLASDSVTEAKILDRSVTNTKIGLLAVQSTELANSAVTEDKINSLAVTVNKIGALAVDASKLASNAVTTAKILDSNVTNSKISLTSTSFTPTATPEGGTGTVTISLNESDYVELGAFAIIEYKFRAVFSAAGRTYFTLTLPSGLTLTKSKTFTGGMVTAGSPAVDPLKVVGTVSGSTLTIYQKDAVTAFPQSTNLDVHILLTNW